MAKIRFFQFILFTIFLFVVTCSSCEINGTGKYMGIFAFGDDIIDPGNNNRLVSFFMKANFLPYGVDFPRGPSGRATNGRTIVDLIATSLSLPYPSPYPYDTNNQNVENIEHGVNFGSIGIGLFGTTAMFTLGRIKHMAEQMDTFKNIVLPQLVDETDCRPHTILPNYLFIIGAGNNDYTSWYILFQYWFINPDLMASMLVGQMKSYIETLYDEGARNFLLIGVYPIGCNPGIVKEDTQCQKYPNDAINKYYKQLLDMTEEVKTSSMPEAEISVLNAGQIILDIHDKKINSGITVTNAACCRLTLIGDICQNGGDVCSNRNRYLYFDGFRLTEAANSYLASQAISILPRGTTTIAPSPNKKSQEQHY